MICSKRLLLCVSVSSVRVIIRGISRVCGSHHPARCLTFDLVEPYHTMSFHRTWYLLAWSIYFLGDNAQIRAIQEGRRITVFQRKDGYIAIIFKPLKWSYENAQSYDCTRTVQHEFCPHEFPGPWKTRADHAVLFPSYGPDHRNHKFSISSIFLYSQTSLFWTSQIRIPWHLDTNLWKQAVVSQVSC